MKITPNPRVQKVAALVQRLDRAEIRELLRLVPQLLDESAPATDELLLWVREQKARYTPETEPMRDDDPFLGGMTVGTYFALPEAERERIWDELYADAIESAPEREVKPDAIVPARQKHRSRDR